MHENILFKAPDALLILVPRHPERFDSVFELCQIQNFHTIRRTADQPVEFSTDLPRRYYGRNVKIT